MTPRMTCLSGLFALTAHLVSGCSSNSDGSPAQAGSAGTSGAGAAGNSAAGTSGNGGASGNAGAGTSGSGGASGSTGGSAGAGGNAGAGGSAGAGGNAGAGGSAGAGGNAGAGGSGTDGGGAAGTTGAADAGQPAPEAGRDAGALHGGSAGRFICPPGVTYGDPVAGVGTTFTTITAPATPPANYFAFVEGPVWVGKLATLFFSDNAASPMERIFKLVPPATMAAGFMENSGSNGLALDNDDNLVLADQRGHRITRVNAMTGQLIGTIVPAGDFKPNDVIMRSDDNLYFSDPDKGFYRSSPQGMLTGPIKTVNRPNGIVLSPDETKLYVGDVGNQTITQFTLGADGAVALDSAKPFATAKGTTVDGMAVDCAGNVYASTQTGVEVYSPSGMFVGMAISGEASNCTFGGDDRKTLYVTSRALVKAIKLGVPGLPD